MGNLFTEEVGNLLTRTMGNYLTEALGKVLDIYISFPFYIFSLKEADITLYGQDESDRSSRRSRIHVDPSPFLRKQQ